MNLSKILFVAVIALVPVQLNKFFFTDSSFVVGIPIDYRAISIYLLDLVIIGYVIIFAKENFKNFKKIYRAQKNFIRSLAIFNLYSAFSATLINTPTETTYFFIVKQAMLSIFSIFATSTFSEKKIGKLVSKAVLIALLIEGVIILGQFSNQGSIGLAILGERTFDTTTTSIAHVNLFGKQLLRSYGTFPHPNVTAAFFIIYLFILVAYTKKFLSKSALFIYFLILGSIVLTFSKSAAAALVTSAISFIDTVKKLLVYLVLTFLLLVLTSRNLHQLDLSTVSERLILAQASLEITGKNLFFGVGPLNFIVELAKLNISAISEIRLLQPVHNIFLLILSENGLIGLMLFTLVLTTVIKNINSKFKLSIFIVLMVFSVTDHFFWTLNQGKLLFWISIAFILSSPRTTTS